MKDTVDEKIIKNVAIIGAGLQAKRRIPAILQDPNYKITWIISLNPEKARDLASLYNAKWDVDWRKAVNDKEVDIVLVLTYPNSHAQISISAMKKGKDVLCEKPLARSINEADEMIKVAKETKKILKCGFNHRYHPAIDKAYTLFRNNYIGKPIFGRAKYGIAGRPGIEKEWRSNPKIVSGGQLMEQGIHLVDLYLWFLGEIVQVVGQVNTFYWPIKPLEDNAFALMQFKNGTTVSIHSSLTQWINTFEFEIYGEKGFLTVQGLGGSYGVEKLIISLHDPDGPFSYETIEFRGDDPSWKKEWMEFTKAIKLKKQPMGNAIDGLRAMETVNAIYKSAKTGRSIRIK